MDDSSSGGGSNGGDFVIDMLPARQGDCVLLTWGQGRDRHRVLVDAGPAIAYDAVRTRLVDVAREGPLDLLVMTHIDRDHIEGTILLTNDAGVAIDIGQVWYNGAPQLTDKLASVHGEILGSILKLRGLPWNSSFDRGAICADGDASLPTCSLSGGLGLTVLGPDRAALHRLRDEWDRTWSDAGLRMDSVPDALEALERRRYLKPGKTLLGGTNRPDIGRLARARAGKDTKVPNASSIVLLAEYGNQRILLAGDSTPDQLLAGVRRYLDEKHLSVLPLTAFKLPHHGSARNINRALIELLPAERYLFSSDGSYFNHPDDAAVATVLAYGPPGAELVFNYDNPRTRKWQDEKLQAAHGYRVRYPEPGSDGVRFALSGAEQGTAR